MWRALVHITLTFGALATIGCSDYAYRSAAATTANPQVAAYRVPAQAPRGQVVVRSSGITALPAEANQPGKALQVSLTVANDGILPWLVDTRKTTIVLPDGDERAPALTVSALGSNGPIIAVPVGSARTIQLYYALSPDEQHARQLPGFATRWQVETAHGTLQGETRFHRVKVDGVTMPCGAQASEYCLSGYAS